MNFEKALYIALLNIFICTYYSFSYAFQTLDHDGVPLTRGLPFSKIQKLDSFWYTSTYREPDLNSTLAEQYVNRSLQASMFLDEQFSMLVSVKTSKTALSKVFLKNHRRRLLLYVQILLKPIQSDSNAPLELEALFVDRRNVAISEEFDSVFRMHDSQTNKVSLALSQRTFFVPASSTEGCKSYTKQPRERFLRVSVKRMSVSPLLVNNLHRVVAVRFVLVTDQMHAVSLKRRLLSFILGGNSNAALAVCSSWLPISIRRPSLAIFDSFGLLDYTRSLAVIPDDYSLKTLAWKYVMWQVVQINSHDVFVFASEAALGGIPAELRHQLWYALSQAHLKRRQSDLHNGPTYFRTLVEVGSANLRLLQGRNRTNDNSVSESVEKSSYGLFPDVPRFQPPDHAVNNYTYLGTQIIYYQVTLAYSYHNRVFGYNQFYSEYVWLLAQFSSNAQDVFWMFASIMDLSPRHGSGLCLFPYPVLLVLDFEKWYTGTMIRFETLMGYSGSGGIILAMRSLLGGSYQTVMMSIFTRWIGTFFADILYPNQRYRVMDALISRVVPMYIVLVVMFKILFSSLAADVQAGSDLATEYIMERCLSKEHMQSFLNSHCLDDTPEDYLMDLIYEKWKFFKITKVFRV